MLSSMFPDRPPGPAFRPEPIVRVVPHEPLAAIRDVLAVSLDDVVNERRLRLLVADLYRITRKVENEGWLRRLDDDEAEREWIVAHL